MLRVATTHIRTGELLCDDLPIRVTSLSDAFMSDGEFKGTMMIDDAVSDYRDAIAAGRVMVWVLWESTPIWVGVLWDHERGSLIDGQFSLVGKTLSSIFNKRVISSALSWTNAQPYTIFEDIVLHAMGKTGGELGNFYGFTTDTTYYTPMTRSYIPADYTNAWDALVALAGDAGFEFHIRPNLDELKFNMLLSAEVIRNAESVPTLSFPGNVVDSNYSYETSSAATHVRVIGVDSSESPLVSVEPYGVAEDLISQGWPLLETVINSGTASGSTQAEINTRANSELASLRESRLLTEVTVVCAEGGVLPTELTIADRVNLSIQDPLYGDIQDAKRVYSIEYLISNNYVNAMKLGVA